MPCRLVVTDAIMKLGDAAGVRGDLDATIALEPTAVEFRVLRARRLRCGPRSRGSDRGLGPGAHRAALADLDRALVLEPESGEALYLRYGGEGELGDATGAQEELLRAGELGWPEAVERLASGG